MISRIHGTGQASLAVAVMMTTLIVGRVAETAKGLGSDASLVLSDQRGNIAASIIALIGGVLFIVFGLVLSDTILSQAATSGGSANIGSFSGAQSLNDIVPLVYYTIIVVGGVTLIGVGGMGVRAGVRGGGNSK